MKLLTKNQTITVDIEAMSHQGEGIARHDGMVVFIPMAAVGDRLRAKVVKVLQNRAYAIIDELLAPSPARMDPACPVYKQCGGCSLRHMGYSHELAVKSSWAADNLARLGGVSVEMEPIIPAPSDTRYRNKAQYPIGLVDGVPRVGFYSRRSHRIVPVEDCLLQPAFFGDICKTVLRFMEQSGVAAYDEATHSGVMRHLYIRHGEMTGQVMVCVVINAKRLPHEQRLRDMLLEACPAIHAVVVNINRDKTNVILGKSTYALLGDGYIEDEICVIRVRISPHSFYQVNRGAAEHLYRTALDYADPGPSDTLLDLYCGAGVIGLSMAHRAGSVIGVEVVPQAVEDARYNAAVNDITNARFITGDAAKAAVQLEREGIRPQIVMLDPPRKGVEPGLIECVSSMKPQRVVYISCNSATLARDCKLFAEHGYKTARARAADFFPRTAHVETVALLTQTP